MLVVSRPLWIPLRPILRRQLDLAYHHLEYATARATAYEAAYRQQLNSHHHHQGSLEDLIVEVAFNWHLAAHFDQGIALWLELLPVPPRRLIRLHPRKYSTVRDKRIRRVNKHHGLVSRVHNQPITERELLSNKTIVVGSDIIVSDG